MVEPFGILWDMDGVLVDTGEFHFQAWLKALASENILFDIDTFRRTFGMNNTSIISMLFGKPPEPEILARIGDAKEAAFRQAIHGKVQLLPGVHDWLDRFARQGVPQAVASSAPQENIDCLIGELGLGGYFRAIVSGANMPGKPDPSVFLEAARRIGVKPERCIVVEDGVPGVEAAGRGGMKCIAVTTTNPRQALQAADVIVDRLDELPSDGFSCLVNL